MINFIIFLVVFFSLLKILSVVVNRTHTKLDKEKIENENRKKQDENLNNQKFINQIMKDDLNNKTIKELTNIFEKLKKIDENINNDTFSKSARMSLTLQKFSSSLDVPLNQLEWVKDWKSFKRDLDIKFKNQLIEKDSYERILNHKIKITKEIFLNFGKTTIEEGEFMLNEKIINQKEFQLITKEQEINEKNELISEIQKYKRIVSDEFREYWRKNNFH